MCEDMSSCVTDIGYMVDKANKASFSITKKSRSLGHITPKIGSYLFNTYVTAILSLIE